MRPSLSVPYTAVIYGRSYQYVVDVEWENLPLPDNCWLLLAAQNFFSSHEAGRLDGQARAMQQVLRFAGTNQEIYNLIQLPKESLDVAQVPRLFGLIESELMLMDISASARYNISRDFRHLTCVGLTAIIPEQSFDRRGIRFTTSFELPRTPSKLLSDAVVIGEDGIAEAPVGALSHTTYEELYSKTKEKISEDLERLKMACHQDLLFFKNMREKLDELGKQSAPRRLVEMVEKQIVTKSINDCHYELRAQYKDQEIISAYMEVYEAKGGSTLNFDEPLYFSKLDEVLIRVLGDYKPYFKKAAICFHAYYRCVGAELLSLYILLLCHTGWNAGSLIGMEKDNVELFGGYWKLQGFKEKTDDYTPPVYIDKEKKDAYNALETLVWHHKVIREQGLIADTEQQFWFVGLYRSGFAQQAVGIIPKKHFLLRHNIPHFSFSDIRNQVFEKDRLEGRNVESIRRKAGHRNRNTTVGYLDSLVSRRIFSSMNLEFSRRLESTVIFRLVENGRVNEPFDSDRVRLDLFHSLGDGSYCVDKNSPPDDLVSFNGVCAALSCHCEGGCKNRKIIVDNSSIKDLVRKRFYYLSNWRRLENNNPTAFQKFHFDSMAYVISLYEYIKSSRYKSFLDDAEEAVNDERKQSGV